MDTPKPTPPSTLLNDVDFNSLALQQIARTLELPAGKTMKDLPGHAAGVMAELKALRKSK